MKMHISEPKYNFSLQKQNYKPQIKEEINPYKGNLDYNLLKNKPKLNGEEIVGNMTEIDPTVPQWAKSETKPDYTSSEIGAVDIESALSLEEIDNMFKLIYK